MERVDIFATQRNSQWGKGMVAMSNHDFEHTHLSWPKKCLMVLKDAGIEGRTLVGKEIESYVAPYIGFATQRGKVGDAVTCGERYGIIRKTGTKRRAEGQPRSYPEYEIIGHFEIDSDSGNMFAVGMHESGGTEVGRVRVPARKQSSRRERRSPKGY